MDRAKFRDFSAESFSIGGDGPIAIERIDEDTPGVQKSRHASWPMQSMPFSLISASMCSVDTLDRRNAMGSSVSRRLRGRLDRPSFLP